MACVLRVPSCIDQFPTPLEMDETVREIFEIFGLLIKGPCVFCGCEKGILKVLLHLKKMYEGKSQKMIILSGKTSKITFIQETVFFLWLVFFYVGVQSHLWIKCGARASLKITMDSTIRNYSRNTVDGRNRAPPGYTKPCK